MKNNEIIRERFEILSQAEEYIGKYISNDWVKKNILQQTDEEINAYWETGEPQDKAGGYGIQGVVNPWNIVASELGICGYTEDDDCESRGKEFELSTSQIKVEEPNQVESGNDREKERRQEDSEPRCC